LVGANPPCLGKDVLIFPQQKTQADVDEAPTFREVMTHLMAWLKEKTSGGSIAWVADGDWDLDIM